MLRPKLPSVQISVPKPELPKPELPKMPTAADALHAAGVPEMPEAPTVPTKADVLRAAGVPDMPEMPEMPEVPTADDALHAAGVPDVVQVEMPTPSDVLAGATAGGTQANSSNQATPGLPPGMQELIDLYVSGAISVEEYAARMQKLVGG